MIFISHDGCHITETDGLTEHGRKRKRNKLWFACFSGLLYSIVGIHKSAKAIALASANASQLAVQAGTTTTGEPFAKLSVTNPDVPLI